MYFSPEATLIVSSLKSKIRIYKTRVRSVIIYAIETRAEITITKRLLGTTEIRTLRFSRIFLAASLMILCGKIVEFTTKTSATSAKFKT